MRKNIIIMVSTILVIVGAWYICLGRPMIEDRQRLESEIQLEEKKLAAYRGALTRFNTRIGEYRRLTQDHGPGPVLFSADEEIIALYKSLDSLCHKPGYKLHEISPSLEETIEFLRQWSRADTTLNMPIRIRIDSDFRSLSRLIEAVEGHRSFHHMKSCRLYGSNQLFPQCALDLTFVAGLGNRGELLDLE